MMEVETQSETEADHKHVFKHVGGGCRVGAVENENERCDDHYKCACGLEFFTQSNATVHFLMPDTILPREDAWDPEGEAPP
jgi:hypothetical protein